MLTKEQYQEFAVAFPDCDLDKAIEYVKSKKFREPETMLRKILREDKHKYLKQEVKEHTDKEKPKTGKELENAEAYRKNNIEAFKAEHNILSNRYRLPRYNTLICGTGTIEEKSCIERSIREAFNPEQGFECTYQEWMQREYAIFTSCYKDFDIDFDNVVKSFVDNLDKYKGKPLHCAFYDYFTYRCRKVADQCLKLIDPDKSDRIDELQRNGLYLLEAFRIKTKSDIQEVKDSILQPEMEVAELF